MLAQLTSGEALRGGRVPGWLALLQVQMSLRGLREAIRAGVTSEESTVRHGRPAAVALQSMHEAREGGGGWWLIFSLTRRRAA